ncbi:MAG: hypothetical protein CL610_09995 [Anaerolineaceae bacterium]|nr:hypothetical protein [Anaerolineaceae bacterium]
MLKTKMLWLLSLILLLGILSAAPASAGDLILNINSGADSTVWFVSGEASLVMNGFDLTPLNINLPAVIDRVSLAVNTPVPGASIDLLIYEDSNGRSPVDARLVSQTQVNITQSGTFTHVFSSPITVTQPVVWIGFYLPVDFRFLADTSGSSVLTYWGWTNGGRFNVNDLSSAQVLGPADGSAPVNINMNGKARITAEISSVGGGSAIPIDPNAPTELSDGPIVQRPGGPDVNTNIMQAFSANQCDTLYRDVDDMTITYSGGVVVECKRLWAGYAPPDPLGYTRQQILYEITIYNDQGFVVTEWLPAGITHCIEPYPDDVNDAVVGLAFGAPQQWEIRPTLRYGNLVCAEIGRSGLLSYFLPTDETKQAAGVS